MPADDFDFSDQLFAPDSTLEPAKPADEPAPEEKTTADQPYATEIVSSYLLVNALLNLLVRKGIIQDHEVNTLVSELHGDYMKSRKERGQRGNQ